jgi:hypothetical protein
MASQKEHKYQSGREVLQKFVPGYLPPEREGEDQDALLTKSVDEVVDPLIAQLKEKLDRLDLRKDKDAGTPNGRADHE